MVSLTRPASPFLNGILLIVLLLNFSDGEFSVQRGDRIAQLIIEKISTVVLEEVESLEDTQRGTGGFGSSGLI